MPLNCFQLFVSAKLAATQRKYCVINSRENVLTTVLHDQTKYEDGLNYYQKDK